MKALLTGRKIALRAPLDEDLPFLASLRNDLELQMALMTLPRANSPRRVQEWLARSAGDAETVFFVIARGRPGKAVGFIQLAKMALIHGTGELGICLTEEARGRGYAAEALRLLEGYVRGVFGIRKIVLHVFASNQRAVGFYKKMGYREVGVHEKHFYQRNAYHDVLIMERLLADGKGSR